MQGLGLERHGFGGVQSAAPIADRAIRDSAASEHDGRNNLEIELHGDR
jgi:hypothetical protein